MTFKSTKKKPPRAKGEGSISQRKDGMWVGSIEVPPGEDGRRRRKYVYAKDQRSLVAKLDELKSDTADGLNLDRTVTVAKWLDYWLPTVHKERIRPSTYRDYGYTVNNICSAIGHKRLVELAPADIRRMHTLIGKGERRAQKAHVVLHRALKDAVAEGIIKRNVVDVVDAPNVRSGERTALAVADVQKVLAYAVANRNEMESTRWLFAFLTGARPGETLGLTWDRVDLEHGAIDITWQLQQLRRAHGCGKRDGDSWPCGRKYGGHCTNPGAYVNCAVEASGCATGEQPNATVLDSNGNVTNAGQQPLASYVATPGTAPDWCPVASCANTGPYVGNVSTVGQALTRSPWGTLDQGGNVVEVTDTISPPPALGNPKIVWRRWHGGVVTATAYQMWLSAVGTTPQTIPGYGINPWRGLRISVRGR